MARDVTDQELYYLRSIYRSLEEMRDLSADVMADYGPSIGSEVLFDNMNFLDCFIDEHERKNAAKPKPFWRSLFARLKPAT